MAKMWYFPYVGVFSKDEIAHKKLLDAAEILAAKNKVAAKVLKNNSEGESLFFACGENTEVFAENFSSGDDEFAAYVFNPRELSLGDTNVEYRTITPSEMESEIQKARESEMYEILKLANNGNDIELNYGIVFCYGEVS